VKTVLLVVGGRFSRFEAYDSRAPAGHLGIAHQAIVERRR